jgi:hypothetical protein
MAILQKKMCKQCTDFGMVLADRLCRVITKYWFALWSLTDISSCLHFFMPAFLDFHWN